MSDSTFRCNGCGSQLTGRAKKWCSEACRLRKHREKNPEYVQRQTARQKELAAKREAERPPKPRCNNCGAEMHSRRLVARFCGAPVCQAASYRAFMESAPCCSKPGCERPVQARGLCGSHYVNEWRAKNPGKASTVRSRYRARKRDAWVEDVDRDEVLERDQWTCGICGRNIPKDAVYPDLKSPSMDHIIPLAGGGEHSMANVQAAHFLCNSVKRHRGEGEQLALT